MIVRVAEMLKQFRVVGAIRLAQQHYWQGEAGLIRQVMFIGKLLESLSIRIIPPRQEDPDHADRVRRQPNLAVVTVRAVQEILGT